MLLVFRKAVEGNSIMAAAFAAAYANLTHSNLLPGESKPIAPTITKVTIDELKTGAHIMVKKVTKDTSKFDHIKMFAGICCTHKH